MFSILMPVHNAGPYLERAVRSVTTQTFTDWELILVDDGSTDGAVETLAVLDTRIRALRQHHQSAPAASNRALGEARRPFVAMLDQDDVWAPAKLQRHADSFGRHPDTDFNFTWSHYIGADDETLPLPRRHWHGHVSFDLLVRDFVIGNSSSVAFRREAAQAIGPFDLGLPCIYDFEFVLRLASLRPDNGVAIEEDLCAYRRHPGQMSRQWRMLNEDWDRLMNGPFSVVAGLTEDTRREAQRNMIRYCSFLAYESREAGAAARLWYRSIRAHLLEGVSDRRTWTLASAIVASSVLPDAVLRRLERLIGWNST